MKKWLFKSQDFITFLFGALSGFWINLITNDIKERGSLFVYGICLTLGGIVLFWWYRRWIGNIDRFDSLIRSETWEKKNFDGVETWTCKDTDEYQLVLGNSMVEWYKEKWTEIFPDNKHNTSYELLLKRNGIIVRKFSWIYCDGGHVFMPIPEHNKWSLYFKKDSLKYRMLDKIGYSNHLDFQEIFKEAEIQII